MSERYVLKIGGSLLDQESSPIRLRELLTQEFAGVQINLFFGGGKVVDALRQLDAIHHFDTSSMHWRCVDLLHLTFELASEWLPGAIQIRTRESFHQHRGCETPGVFLISSRAFYTPEDGDVLPCDWDTTSDSIAALLAGKLRAKRLVLVKSCAIPDSLTASQAASLGIVDANFPNASQGLDIQWLTFERLVARRD